MSQTSFRVHTHNIRRGLVAPFVVFGIVAVALIGGGAYYYLNSGGEGDEIDPIMANVTRGEFVSQVLDQGEVQSSENIEIRCEVRARNGSLSVLSVTPEGSLVKAGDFLVQLDSTSFEKELEQQNISLANAETGVIQAESSLESAKASLEEFIKGTFEQEKLKIQNEIYDADAEIKTAQQQLLQAKDVLGHSSKLQAKGYITKQQLESDDFSVRRNEISVKKGENSLKLAREKLKVLEEITFKKETVQFDADIRAAEVKLVSEKKALVVEKEKLAEIEEMIEKCTIKVPEGVSGQVVYAKESSRGGNDWVLEEGTTVRQNQVLIRLPNPDKMEVKALINEQSITRIGRGMPCTIKVDALNSTTLKGIVTKVNQYAESSGWMSSSVRKYAVFVKILDPPEALKPGMNASVTIQVQYEPDVLLAPIQTVYSVQDQQFCLVRNGDQWETRTVEIGGDNAQMVYFDSGVEENLELVMNPGAYKQYMELPELALETKIDLPEGSADSIGKTSEESADAKKPDDKQAGGGRPGGTQGGGRPGGGGGGGFSVDGMIDGMMGRYDGNGDGKIDADEMSSLSERAKPMVEAADGDGDGSVTKEELKSAMQKRMQSGGFGGGGGGQRGGGGGGQRGGQ